MNIIAAYPAVLEDGTELVPGQPYELSQGEAQALIYRGHARKAEPLNPPSAEEPLTPPDVEESTEGEAASPTPNRRTKNGKE